MATRPRSSGLFSGLVLTSVGVLLLLHTYGHLDLNDFFGRWWPLMIIFWGAVKLYERTAGRFGTGGGRITGGEVLLVLGMLALLGTVVAVIVVSAHEAGVPGAGHAQLVRIVPRCRRPAPTRHAVPAEGRRAGLCSLS